MCNLAFSQNKHPYPLFKGSYPNVFKILSKNVWHLFDSTHSNGLVIVGFSISEKGVLENICFSGNFGNQVIQDSVINSLLLTNDKHFWEPAYQNNLPVRKIILQPILYKYSLNDNTIDIENISELFLLTKCSFNDKRYLDAIILPICFSGFSMH